MFLFYGPANMAEMYQNCDSKATLKLPTEAHCRFELNAKVARAKYNKMCFYHLVLLSVANLTRTGFRTSNWNTQIWV